MTLSTTTRSGISFSRSFRSLFRSKLLTRVIKRKRNLSVATMQWNCHIVRATAIDQRLVSVVETEFAVEYEMKLLLVAPARFNSHKTYSVTIL